MSASAPGRRSLSQLSPLQPVTLNALSMHPLTAASLYPHASTPVVKDGAVLLEQARGLRYAIGVEETARWLEAKGIPRALGIVALVGGNKAARYGVRIFDG